MGREAADPRRGLQAGVLSVMVSYSSVRGTKMHRQPRCGEHMSLHMHMHMHMHMNMSLQLKHSSRTHVLFSASHRTHEAGALWSARPCSESRSELLSLPPRTPGTPTKSSSPAPLEQGAPAGSRGAPLRPSSSGARLCRLPQGAPRLRRPCRVRLGRRRSAAGRLPHALRRRHQRRSRHGHAARRTAPPRSYSQSA